MYSHIQRKDCPVMPLTFYSFFTVAAGFVLNKAKLFPTEATRGGAQVVLVRRPTSRRQVAMYMSWAAELIVFLFDRMSPCRASSSPVSFLHLVRRTSVRWRR